MRSTAEALSAIAARPDGQVVLPVLRQTPGAFLVGGAVRDALLGRDPRELDVVVVGDPAPLIAALGGEVVERHERFGTTIINVDGQPVDVVQARSESYAAPGALPDVAPGTLAQDLERRDVTINAIALDADGVLYHVEGALEDLEAGSLRVLHDRSFVDDPTRLWRVARYAVRLQFAVDEHTAALAANADPATASGPRHGNELRLALTEPDPRATLTATAAINGGLFPEGFVGDPPRLDAALRLLPPDGRKDLVTLAACCALVDAKTLVEALDAWAFTAHERDIVAAGSRGSTHAPLHNAKTNSEIARAARNTPVEVVALAGGDNARRWIDDLRHVTLDIDGNDLIAAGVAPGPELGRRLQQALDAKLDGHASGRDAELQAALA